MAVRIGESLEGIDWYQVKADLAADAFDNGRSSRALHTSFARSQHVAIARDGDRVVAMARLLSDGVLQCLPCTAKSSAPRADVAGRAISPCGRPVTSTRPAESPARHTVHPSAGLS